MSITHGVQMWTPLQVFSNGYVYTDKIQLPLYNGIPNKVNCLVVVLTKHTVVICSLLASYIAT